MAIQIIDSAFRQAYFALQYQQDRAQAIVDVINGPVTIKVYSANGLRKTQVHAALTVLPTIPRRVQIGALQSHTALTGSGEVTHFTLGSPTVEYIRIDLLAPNAAVFAAPLSADYPEYFANLVVAMDAALPVDSGSLPESDVLDLTIDSVSAAALPYSGAAYLSAGVVPSGNSVGLADGQASVWSTHPDGSARIVKWAGKKALASGANTLKLRRLLAPQGGTNVTLANLISANPQCSIRFQNVTNSASAQLVGDQTLTLASVLNLTPSWGANPVNHAGGLVHSMLGPVMSEFRFYAPVGAAQIAVFWDVRFWATGECEITTKVESCPWLFTANKSVRNYTVTLTVGGAQRYTATLAHYSHQYWSRVDWVGADPQTIAWQDMAALKASKAVPNYLPLAASQAAIDSGVYTTYASAQAPTPLALSASGRGRWLNTTAASGDSDFIGPLTYADSVFVSTPNRKTWANAIGLMREYGLYSTVYRDETTGLPPNPYVAGFAYTGLPANGYGMHYGQGACDVHMSNPIDAAPFNYDPAHLPSAGYLAFIATGRYEFYEAHRFSTVWAVFNQQSAVSHTLADWGSERNGVQGLCRGAFRQVAWTFRNVCRQTILEPTFGDQSFRNGLISSIQFNADHYDTTRTTGIWANNLGVSGSTTYQADYAPGNDGVFDHSMFMFDFLSYSWTHAAQLGLPVNAGALTKIGTLAAFTSSLQIGLINAHYRHAGGYAYPFGNSTYNAGEGGQTPTSWYTDFATMMTAYLAKAYSESGKAAGTAAGTTTAGQSLLLGDAATPIYAAAMAQSYYATKLPALAQAIDLGVSGASAAMDKITTSSSWIAHSSQFADYPKYGVAAR